MIIGYLYTFKENNSKIDIFFLLLNSSKWSTNFIVLFLLFFTTWFLLSFFYLVIIKYLFCPCIFPNNIHGICISLFMEVKILTIVIRCQVFQNYIDKMQICFDSYVFIHYTREINFKIIIVYGTFFSFSSVYSFLHKATEDFSVIYVYCELFRKDLPWICSIHS